MRSVNAESVNVSFACVSLIPGSVKLAWQPQPNPKKIGGVLEVRTRMRISGADTPWLPSLAHVSSHLSPASGVRARLSRANDIAVIDSAALTRLSVLINIHRA